jgi:hypothetical protein
MDIGGDHGGVDANLTSLFNLLLLRIGHENSVYGLPCGMRQRLDSVTEGGSLESFMGNTDTTKAPIARGVNDMECELIVAIVFHLLHNRTTNHLLRAFKMHFLLFISISYHCGLTRVIYACETLIKPWEL